MSSRAKLVALASVLAILALPSTARGAAGYTIHDPIVIPSFDGTPIVATLMLPEGASGESPVPVVLKTHGWGGNRDRTPSGLDQRLLDAGYAVFTWDARGFGDSGGEVHIDSPEFEVKDVIALIDWLGDRAEIQRDGPGDPRAGWIGGSYAGGIQLNTEAFDHRVDALVPEIAWADLTQDLFPNDVIKKTWDQLLYGAGLAAAQGEGLDSPAGPQTGAYAQEIHEAEAQGTATGTVDPELKQWFHDKSTVIRSQNVTAPTMIMQGTVDTLFPLEDGFANYENIFAAGTPVKLVGFCGGHTIEGCPYPGGSSGNPSGEAGTHYDDLIVRWLDRYVRGMDVGVGPAVEWQAEDGFYYGAPSLPLPNTTMVEGEPLAATLTGPGTDGGDSGTAGQPTPAFELGSTAARDVVLGPQSGDLSIVGIPEVHVTGTMTAAVDGNLFFELVDKAPDGTETTVDAQTMPARIEAGRIDRSVDLHGVAWILRAGHALELEITTGSTQYDATRTGAYSADITATVRVPMTPFGNSVGDRTS